MYQHGKRHYFGMLATAVLCLAMRPAFADAIEVVESFDASLGETPESIASDSDGNIYMSMSSSIWKRTPEGELSVFGTLPIAVFALGVKVGPDDCVYTVSTSLSEVDGAFVWQICEEGEVTQFAELDHTGGLNDLVFDRFGNMFVTDPFQGRIWKIEPNGDAEVWLDNALLDGNPENPALIFHALGANGIVFDRCEGHLYVANTDYGAILRIRVKRDGGPGRIDTVVTDPLLTGADGLVFDRRGNLLVAVNGQDSIVEISRQGDIDIVENGGLLDGPSSLLLSAQGCASSLYIANSAFLRAFGLIEGEPHPALLKYGL